MTTKPAVVPERPYHHGNVRAELISAGLTLIAERGVGAVTLREIGKRIGVSRMAAYRHFGDKSDLLAAISEAGFAQFADALEAASGRKGLDSWGRLRALAVAYVRFAAEHRAHFEVMFSPVAPINRSCAPQADRAFAVLENAVRKAQLEGGVRAGDPVRIARSLWALVHGISQLGLENDPAGKAQFVRFSCELLETGLNPR